MVGSCIGIPTRRPLPNLEVPALQRVDEHERRRVVVVCARRLTDPAYDDVECNLKGVSDGWGEHWVNLVRPSF